MGEQGKKEEGRRNRRRRIGRREKTTERGASRKEHQRKKFLILRLVEGKATPLPLPLSLREWAAWELGWSLSLGWRSLRRWGRKGEQGGGDLLAGGQSHSAVLCRSLVSGWTESERRGRRSRFIPRWMPALGKFGSPAERRRGP